MAAFVRLNPDRARLDGGTRVLEPEDYQLVMTAAEVLADARENAAATRAAAVQQYEDQKRRGYEDGMAAARAEISEQMLEIVTRSVDYLANAERQVARTVLLCLRKVLGEFSEEELVLRAARNALDIIRNETRVTLRVRPDVQPALRDRVGDILRDHGDIGFLEVVADPGIAEGGCRLETEIGVVDASIGDQIAALERIVWSRTGAGPAGSS